jgi:murein DD-endopeptidase MepM/ murein hydrolase activator NlpD
MQYKFFQVEAQKMILVRQEYYHVIGMLKEALQNKNSDEITDDLDTLDDVKNEVDENRKDIEQSISLSSQELDDAIEHKEDVLEDTEDSEDEEVKGFQFISSEDEKQLKDLRKQTRQNVQIRKKTKKKPLAQKQINQLKKTTPESSIKDFTFHWPLELHHFWISSLFGARKKANGAPGFHYGIDLAAMKGTSVKAAAAGVVIQAQYLPGYGNNILIQHNKYYRTRYAHLHTMNVSEGQKVLIGQKIGTVGATGSVRKSGRDASHLHFEIYHNGSHVNPLRYLFN